MALALLDIHPAPGAVLVGHRRHIEAIQLPQPFGVPGRVGWPVRDQHRGQGLAHATALEGTVVDEDDRFQPEVQFLHELDDVVCLVVPVDAPSGQVRAA